MFKGVCVMVVLAAQLFLGGAVSADPLKFDIVEFTVEGNTLLSERKIRIALASFTGEGREMTDVNKAADALRALYQQAGYAVVRVVAPVQTVTAGKVLLKVIEDKVATIVVKGNAAYSAENIRASLPVLQIGKSLNAQHLEAAIALANENSAKQVAVNVQPAATLGELDTRIDVSEDRVSKMLASLDNTGSLATGYAKIGLAYQHANLWDRDHALTVQYNGAPELLDKIGSINVGYHIPYYQDGLSLDLIAAYSSSSTQNGSIYFAGKGTVFGARVNYALTSIGDIRHKVIAGFDYKKSNNSFTGCVAPCASITEQPFSLAYYAQVTRPDFQSSGGFSLVSNLPGGTQNGSVNYQAARVAASGSTLVATPNWSALRMNLGLGFSLPNDWQIRAMGNGQYSRDLLIPAEQFGAGGALSVRGYPERVVAGEKGYIANFELYSPDFNKYFPIPNDSLRTLIFWDTARTTVNDQPLSPHSYLSSYGLGLRVVHNRVVNIKFDLGWAQKRVPYLGSLTPKNDVRGHFAISFVF
ncbi:MAG: ShlB/FhaC/HecB family hemolysin secretion/activation protein [Gallionella sp.]|nr:ShlB/FhaC/HecB family hemolysin secretion/activation protein [Gallionella sp.]